MQEESKEHKANVIRNVPVGVNQTLDTRIFSPTTYLDKKCSVVHYWREIKGFSVTRRFANGQNWLFEHLQTVTKELQDKGLLNLVSVLNARFHWIILQSVAGVYLKNV